MWHLQMLAFVHLACMCTFRILPCVRLAVSICHLPFAYHPFPLLSCADTLFPHCRLTVTPLVVLFLFALSTRFQKQAGPTAVPAGYGEERLHQFDPGSQRPASQAQRFGLSQDALPC